MSRLLSLAHLTVLRAHPLKLIELAACAGFDAVGLRIWPPGPNDTVVPVIDAPDLQAAIRRRLHDTGIRLYDVEAFWLWPDSDLARFRRGYEVGAELGARHVVLTGNDPDPARLADNFGRTCEDAAACGLTPMLEFIPYSAVRSLGAACDLRRAAGADNAGILVDALHLARSGGTPADLAAYPPDLFRYAHLCDAPAASPADSAGLRAEARGARLYPGEGELWLADLLAALPADIPVAVEAPTATHGHLPLLDQARMAATLSRSVLEQVRQRGE